MAEAFVRYLKSQESVSAQSRCIVQGIFRGEHRSRRSAFVVERKLNPGRPEDLLLSAVPTAASSSGGQIQRKLPTQTVSAVLVGKHSEPMSHHGSIALMAAT